MKKGENLSYVTKALFLLAQLKNCVGQTQTKRRNVPLTPHIVTNQKVQCQQEKFLTVVDMMKGPHKVPHLIIQDVSKYCRMRILHLQQMKTVKSITDVRVQWYFTQYTRKNKTRKRETGSSAGFHKTGHR
ncbi:uncharacterized protein LOC144487408 isoform X2 [Mustelus asterias]